jgi:hypothetical protein
VLTPSRQQITLGTVATVRISDGPPMLRSENGRPVTWIYVDGRGSDMAGLVGDINRAITSKVAPPPGVSVSYTGQYEFLVRAKERMKLVIPVTLAIIFALLYLTFRRWDEALLIMGTLPFALTGGLWLLYLAGLQPVGRNCGRVHRARRRRRRVRGGHADLPQAGARGAQRRRCCRRGPRRRAAARPAQGDDRRGDPRRSAPGPRSEAAPVPK